MLKRASRGLSREALFSLLASLSALAPLLIRSPWSVTPHLSRSFLALSLLIIVKVR